MRRSWLVIILGALLHLRDLAVRRMLRGKPSSLDCLPSHRAPDDPIVYPEQPGASHLTTSSATQRRTHPPRTPGCSPAGRTCEEPGDTAAYWAPALLSKDGTADPSPTDQDLLPGPTQAGCEGCRRSRPISGWSPVGWRPRASSRVGTATARRSPTVRIDCSGGTPGHTYVRGRVIFPMCGRLDATGAIVTDSADHRSHVVYGSNKTGCPADHPVQLPAIKVNIRYGVSNCIAARVLPVVRHDGRSARQHFPCRLLEHVGPVRARAAGAGTAQLLSHRGAKEPTQRTQRPQRSPARACVGRDAGRRESCGDRLILTTIVVATLDRPFSTSAHAASADQKFIVDCHFAHRAKGRSDRLPEATRRISHA